MRTLTTVLAICGGIWALSGIAGWFLTLESFLYVETGKDLLISLVTVVLLTSGYFVWWGWVFHSFKERFPFVTQQSFWVICLVHHVFSVLYLIPMNVCGGGDDPWWIPLWIIGNILIAATVLVRSPWNRTQAEQVGADQPATAQESEVKRDKKPNLESEPRLR